MKLAQNFFLALTLFISAFIFLSRPTEAVVSNSVPQNPKIISQNQLAGVQTAGLLEDIWDKVTGLGDQIRGLQTSLEDLLNPANLWNFLFGDDPKCTGNDIISRFTCMIISRGMTAVIKGGINATSTVFLGGGDVYDPKTGNTIILSERHPIWSFNMVRTAYQNMPRNATFDSLSYIVKDALVPFGKTAEAGWTKPNLSSRLIVGAANEIWGTTRNIAYISIVVILVVFGFAVMFRYKTDPRTVVTVEQAIPGLALGLIAIAFSTLVPALALDFSKVIQGTTDSIFKPLNRVVDNNTGYKFQNCFKGGATNTSGLCEVIPVGSPIDLTFNGSLDDISGDLVGRTLNTDRAVNGAIAWAINTAVLVTYLTIFVSVIMRYASLIVRSVLGPLVIALGIIPGQRNAIAGWLKGCLADSLSIAGVYFMINLAVYLWDLSLVESNIPVGLVPQSRLSIGDLMAGTASSYNILWVVSIGVAIMATKVPAYIDEALGTSPTAASRSGVDFRQAMRATPLVGQFF